MNYTMKTQSEINHSENLIVWDPKFETGILFIDNEHKTLVELCNNAYKLILSNKDKETWHDVVRSTIKECADYCKVHFSDEERLMTAIKFGNFEAHKKRHEEFILKVVEMAKGFDSMTVADAIKFVKFLYDWVLSHIAHEDTQYIKEALKHCDKSGNFLL